MSPTLFRYVLRTYFVFFVGIFAAMVAVYLVVDFVDRSRLYNGPNWIHDVAILYAFKALTVAQQLGPAVMMLGAGTAVSALRKRGELTALKSLSFGPSTLLVPVLALALVAGAALIGFDEKLVVRASRRAEEIQTGRFDSWGDWMVFHSPKHWFRRNNRIFYLRGGDPTVGFEEVTLLELTPSFELARRVDAARMEFVSGNTWRLSDVVIRTFTGPEAGAEGMALAHEDSRTLDLGVGPNALRIRSGRPEQLRLFELREQIRARRAVGLPTKQYDLALHNRFAYPLAGVPAALLAAALAIRPNRRGNLTVALLEGVAIAMALWGLMVICKAMVLTGRLPPAVAAWTPPVGLSLAAALLWLQEEGVLQRRPRDRSVSA